MCKTGPENPYSWSNFTEIRVLRLPLVDVCNQRDYQDLSRITSSVWNFWGPISCTTLEQEKNEPGKRVSLYIRGSFLVDLNSASRWLWSCFYSHDRHAGDIIKVRIKQVYFFPVFVAFFRDVTLSLTGDFWRQSSILDFLGNCWPIGQFEEEY